MIHSLHISQLISGRTALRIGVPGVIVGAVVASASSVSALSIPLRVHAEVPPLPPVDIAADIKLLDTPSGTAAGVSAGVTTPDGSVSSPPIAVPARPPDIPPPAADTPVTNSDEPGTIAPARPAAPSRAADAVSEQPALPAGAAAADAPLPKPKTGSPAEAGAHNFDLMPRPLSGDTGSFQAALIVLSAVAVSLIGLATFTTARLARGSPKP